MYLLFDGHLYNININLYNTFNMNIYVYNINN